MVHNWTSNLSFSVCICVVASATCDWRRLSRWSYLLKFLPMTWTKVRVIRFEKRRCLYFSLISIKISLESAAGVGNKMILSRYRTRQTGLADQSYFLTVILSRHVFKIWQLNGKKTKIVCFAKIWKPPRQHFGFFEDLRNFAKPHKI